jgi:chromosome segregation ATPase
MTGAEFATRVNLASQVSTETHEDVTARLFDSAVASLRTGISNAEKRELEALAESDELRAQVALLTAERDYARTQQGLGWSRAAEKDRAYGEALRERDEARAQLAAAYERADKAEAECAVWRREADACAAAAGRLRERAERAEADVTELEARLVG